ncbi:hypothetical protein BCh11DRAFT_07354 [Burkholderia sp. Ch1-1]|uniref:Uncharacterized protein n=1 Tax=Caballeronia udeis TaxID=1232866 RepID=A0A158JLT5_9BURK|nr:hypothetical protein BCh11DRAFT_07354 [Burkholderia sp. Ch1-1]CAE6846947.1 hypothetical protein R20943_07384 [Paraburkholderia aspalathi]SAL69625.1 hypothetical protein AWB69_08238 [Caballeronia udeis]
MLRSSFEYLAPLRDQRSPISISDARQVNKGTRAAAPLAGGGALLLRRRVGRLFIDSSFASSCSVRLKSAHRRFVLTWRQLLHALACSQSDWDRCTATLLSHARSSASPSRCDYSYSRAVELDEIPLQSRTSRTRCARSRQALGQRRRVAPSTCDLLPGNANTGFFRRQYKFSRRMENRHI